MKQTGLQFAIEPGSYEEDMTLPLPPEKLVAHLSLGKAKAVADRHDDAIVIGADTFVVFEGRFLGKPKSIKEARVMLRALSKNECSIITGYSIVDCKSGKVISRTDESKIYFKKLSEQEIDEYIATGEPMDKAGAFAVQGLGGKLIKRIDGEMTSIMGLPINLLQKDLNEFGIR